MRYSVLVIAALLIPASFARAQFLPDTYLPDDVTITSSNSVARTAILGYASESDYFNNLHPTSPTINLVAGGSIGDSLQAYNNSVFNFSGGSIHGGIDAYDHSAIHFSGGDIGNGITAQDTSVVDVSGGTIAYDLFAYTNSVVTISGSSIGSIVYAYNTSVVTISGGFIADSVTAFNNSIVNIRGGSLGPAYYNAYYAQDSSVYNFFGANLNATLIFQIPGSQEYELEGTLQDGTMLNGQTFFVNGPDARFHLIPAAVTPEPGSIALLAGLMFSGAGVFVRRRGYTGSHRPCS